MRLIALSTRMRAAVMTSAAVLLSFAPTVAAQVSTGLGETAAEAGIKGSGTLEFRLGGILARVMGLIGIVFMLLIVYGGIMWMIAGGDEKKISTAKNVIVGAVIGLVIILSAYAITEFIFGAVGITTTQTIPN